AVAVKVPSPTHDPPSLNEGARVAGAECKGRRDGASASRYGDGGRKRGARSVCRRDRQGRRDIAERVGGERDFEAERSAGDNGVRPGRRDRECGVARGDGQRGGGVALVRDGEGLVTGRERSDLAKGDGGRRQREDSPARTLGESD